MAGIRQGGGDVPGRDVPEVGVPVGVGGGYLAVRGKSGRDDALAVGILQPGGECEAACSCRATCAAELPLRCLWRACRWAGNRAIRGSRVFARNTTAIPPAPIRSSSRYPASREPPSSRARMTSACPGSSPSTVPLPRRYGLPADHCLSCGHLCMRQSYPHVTNRYAPGPARTARYITLRAQTVAIEPHARLSGDEPGRVPVPARRPLPAAAPAHTAPRGGCSSPSSRREV